MKTIRFPDGAQVPALGQGTWMMAERADRRADEIAALRAGVELGMTLIDTAEMYADGESERLVGEAIAGRREAVFLVSKAYPQNASRARLAQACESSLRRLGTDRLDLYLLHWRGGVPLAETVEAMTALVATGKIVRWGVSNLDTDDLAELIAAGGAACATDQILYNLTGAGPSATCSRGWSATPCRRWRTARWSRGGSSAIPRSARSRRRLTRRRRRSRWRGCSRATA